MVMLAEAKNYLRVDGTDDDALLTDMLKTAEKLVQDVGRMSEDEMSSDENADISRTAVLFCLSYLYENRNGADMHKLAMNLRYLLFAQREGAF